MADGAVMVLHSEPHMMPLPRQAPLTHVTAPPLDTPYRRAPAKHASVQEAPMAMELSWQPDVVVMALESVRMAVVMAGQRPL
jgi:hypothetical protein